MATFSDVHEVKKDGYRSLEVGMIGPIVEVTLDVDGGVSISAYCADESDLPLFREMIDDQLRWLKEQEGGGSGDVQ